MQFSRQPKIHLPETQKSKFRLVLAMFAVALIFAAVLSGSLQDGIDVLLLSLLFFPAGLASPFIDLMVRVFSRPNYGSGLGETVMALGIPIGWILYLVIALLYISSENLRISRLMLFVFTVLLITNVVGCSGQFK